MTIMNRCPVCRNAIKSTESTQCPECGAALVPERPAASSAEIKDIIETVKQQIDMPGEHAGTQSPDMDNSDGDATSELLSSVDFQSVLDESLGDDESVLSGGVQGDVTGQTPDFVEKTRRGQSIEPLSEPPGLSGKESLSPSSKTAEPLAANSRLLPMIALNLNMILIPALILLVL